VDGQQLPLTHGKITKQYQSYLMEITLQHKLGQKGVECEKSLAVSEKKKKLPNSKRS
jgi:hypothetical protein